jgi:hypothetical protein
MATIDPRSIPAEIMAELDKTVANAIQGGRDPDAMAHAAERMDRMREEMRRRVGEGEWAVPLARETRDEAGRFEFRAATERTKSHRRPATATTTASTWPWLSGRAANCWRPT